MYHEVPPSTAEPEIWYAVLGEGKLQFFSARENGLLMKEVSLTRTRLKIRAIMPNLSHGCPHGFSLTIERVKLFNGRQMAMGKPEKILLSAPSSEEKKKWASAIHYWQRKYWHEPDHVEAQMDPEAVRAYFQQQYEALQGFLREQQNADKAGSSKKRNSLKAKMHLGKNSSKMDASDSMVISLPPVTLDIAQQFQQSAY